MERLRMNGSNTNSFDDESLDDLAILERRKKTMERKRKDQSKDVEGEEEKTFNTDDRSADGEKLK